MEEMNISYLERTLTILFQVMQTNKVGLKPLHSEGHVYI